MATLEEPIKGVTIVKNYINGEWIESNGEFKDVINPTNCQTIAKVPVSTEEEMNAAVEAAKAAFPDWRRTTPLARSRMLSMLSSTSLMKHAEH